MFSKTNLMNYWKETLTGLTEVIYRDTPDPADHRKYILTVLTLFHRHPTGPQRELTEG